VYITTNQETRNKILVRTL